MTVYSPNQKQIYYRANHIPKLTDTFSQPLTDGFHKVLIYCKLDYQFFGWPKQRVNVVDGISTEWDNISKGVPQRTVLGPVLFTIMVNDISPVNMTKL